MIAFILALIAKAGAAIAFAMCLSLGFKLMDSVWTVCVA